ncbi:MAG: HD domain-containing protein [Saprospiraceae bacterium]|nr:HD domain-containing protein [Saprospiraceae bacterium]
MNKNKIFNDPVYGFVSIHFEILYDLIQHPYFQRLRRITQLGMTHLTYPGAVHTRFHHALGALHLMNMTLDVLRQKGAEISDAEAEAASIAILLHDIGHGPFSHALEGRLIETHHEVISAHLLDILNKQFGGRLSLGISIFKNTYPKKFLHQLISGQLDLDRMDYLNRDSFYTGVMEGKIGFDRIIKMLRVENGHLMVEEKGIASIEKFLVARKIMYWQVYLHKTVLSAETMLIGAIERAKRLFREGGLKGVSSPLAILFTQNWSDVQAQPLILEAFVQLDDVDIMILLKNSIHYNDLILNTLAQGLIQRRLFQVRLSNNPAETADKEKLMEDIAQATAMDKKLVGDLVYEGQEQVEIYNGKKDQIKIYGKDGRTMDLNEILDSDYFQKTITKYYLCYPRIGS